MLQCFGCLQKNYTSQFFEFFFTFQIRIVWPVVDRVDPEIMQSLLEINVVSVITAVIRMDTVLYSLVQFPRPGNTSDCPVVCGHVSMETRQQVVEPVSFLSRFALGLYNLLL